MSYLGTQTAVGGPVPGDPTRTTIVVNDSDGNPRTLTVTYPERATLWRNMYEAAGAHGDFFAFSHDVAVFPGGAGTYEQAVSALATMRAGG